MTIHIECHDLGGKYRGIDHVEQLQKIKITIDADSIKPFVQLVRRALNTGPDAHPDLKAMGDMLDHGRVLQDYQVQRTDRRN